jgi:thymidylate synthase ThyX
MTIEAKIIRDSVGPEGQRITTMQLKYPRFIHAEFMTHRLFSRNASSSRAIPTRKFIEQIRDDPGMPNHWGANQPGMQADNQIDPKLHEDAANWWKNNANMACGSAWDGFKQLGLHKQVVNRILEPYQHMNVIVTSTQWGNFFALRCHADAEPNIQELAYKMRDIMNDSKPRPLTHLEWHLPYVSDEEIHEYLIVDGGWQRLLVMSAARCARVSYMNHDGSTPSYDDDYKLYNQLVGSFPIHASPVEHQAYPDVRLDIDNDGDPVWTAPKKQGNLQGFVQFRKTIEGECVP